MSLNWDLTRIENKDEVCFETRDDGKQWESGGIGRRIGLKIRYSYRVWGFKSLLSHL